MAWTAPKTWTDGELVSAALMNTHLRDNLDYLKTRDDTAMNYGVKEFNSPYTTTSSSFVDIAASLNLTLSISGLYPILLGFSTAAAHSATGGEFKFDVFDTALGGRIGTFAYGAQFMQLPVANQHMPFTWFTIVGLAAGSHTFKPQFSTAGGTLTLNGLQLRSAFLALELR